MVQSLNQRVTDTAVGSICTSIDTYKSELRAWNRFCQMLQVAPIPADEDTVMKFMTVVRSAKSAKKYLAAIRWAYDFVTWIYLIGIRGLCGSFYGDCILR